MPYYKLTLTPSKSPAGRWRTHLRSVDIVFTARDDEMAQEIVQGSLTDFFLGTGNDPELELRQL